MHPNSDKLFPEFNKKMYNKKNNSAQEAEKNSQKGTKKDFRYQESVIVGTTIAGAEGVRIVKDIVNHERGKEIGLTKQLNDCGKPVGHGHMFENIVMRENPGSYKINEPGSNPNMPHLRKKDGADVHLPHLGDAQCKCHHNAQSAFNALFDKDGNFRYPGQTICVPRGQGAQMKRLLREKKLYNRVVESQKTYDEVLKLSRRGVKSFMYDIKDRHLLCEACAFGLVVAGVVYLWFDYTSPKEAPQKPIWKKALKAVGAGFGATIAVIGAVGVFHQIQRPK